MKKARTLGLALLGAIVLAGAPDLAEAKHPRHGHKGHGFHRGHGHHGGHGHHAYRYHRRHHPRAHFSFWLSPLWWGPRYHHPAYAYPYPYPYPYHRETTVIVQEPPVYVERPESEAAAEGWWYFCESAEAYYPEAQSCPEGWVKVPPRPE